MAQPIQMGSWDPETIHKARKLVAVRLGGLVVEALRSRGYKAASSVLPMYGPKLPLPAIVAVDSSGGRGTVGFLNDTAAILVDDLAAVARVYYTELGNERRLSEPHRPGQPIVVAPAVNQKLLGVGYLIVAPSHEKDRSIGRLYAVVMSQDDSYVAMKPPTYEPDHPMHKGAAMQVSLAFRKAIEQVPGFRARKIDADLLKPLLDMGVQLDWPPD